MHYRRKSNFHKLEAKKRELLDEKAAERAAIAAERAAEAAEDTAKATRASALYMLLSVIVLATSSLIAVAIAIFKR
jgi:hypothetical protein